MQTMHAKTSPICRYFDLFLQFCENNALINFELRFTTNECKCKTVERAICPAPRRVGFTDDNPRYTMQAPTQQVKPVKKRDEKFVHKQSQMKKSSSNNQHALSLLEC